MTGSVWGLVLALVGGVLVGNCMLPLKRIRIWPWECTWLVFSLVSLLIVPCLVAFLVVPGWLHIYHLLAMTDLLPAIIFGFGWGIAQVLFGISVVRLGMALAFTIVVGLGTVFGTIVPLVVLHKDSFSNGNAAELIAGCGIMILGVALSGYAGKLREQRQSESEQGYVFGLSIAILAGVLSSMLNLSLAFGQPIANLAIHRGVETSSAVFAVWPVALASGLIPNLGYAGLLLYRNHSWKFLRTSAHDLSLSILMGLLWIGAVLVYGVSTRYLGKLGDAAGWAIYQIAMVLTANVTGIVTGEWKSATRSAWIALSAGLCILVIATIVTSISTR